MQKYKKYLQANSKYLYSVSFYTKGNVFYERGENDMEIPFLHVKEAIVRQFYSVLR